MVLSVLNILTHLILMTNTFIHLKMRKPDRVRQSHMIQSDRKT